mmetsp:Transcript_21908/g.50388  ORF Transcript_21908/g.50388 Transcript_21908/m.50388 type:complete len:266 (+) Transcript_21908:1179-1976(+)
MYLSASPSAWVPVAHALTMPKLGPWAPSSMAIMEPAVLPMSDGSKKGVMRLGPLLKRISQLCSTVARPPTPEPTSTPKRFGATAATSSSASASAVLAAPIARCVYRSCLFASFGSQNLDMSKSRTSLAIFVWNFSGSKRVTSRIPHLPSRRLSKKVCASRPSEVIVPRPVTTTFRFLRPSAVILTPTSRQRGCSSPDAMSVAPILACVCKRSPPNTCVRSPSHTLSSQPRLRPMNSHLIRRWLNGGMRLANNRVQPASGEGVRLR